MPPPGCRQSCRPQHRSAGDPPRAQRRARRPNTRWCEHHRAQPERDVRELVGSPPLGLPHRWPRSAGGRGRHATQGRKAPNRHHAGRRASASQLPSGAVDTSGLRPGCRPCSSWQSGLRRRRSPVAHPAAPPIVGSLERPWRRGPHYQQLGSVPSSRAVARRLPGSRARRHDGARGITRPVTVLGRREQEGAHRCSRLLRWRRAGLGSRFEVSWTRAAFRRFDLTLAAGQRISAHR